MKFKYLNNRANKSELHPQLVKLQLLLPPLFLQVTWARSYLLLDFSQFANFGFFLICLDFTSTPQPYIGSRILSHGCQIDLLNPSIEIWMMMRMARMGLFNWIFREGDSNTARAIYLREDPANLSWGGCDVGIIIVNIIFMTISTKHLRLRERAGSSQVHLFLFWTTFPQSLF